MGERIREGKVKHMSWHKDSLKGQKMKGEQIIITIIAEYTKQVLCYAIAHHGLSDAAFHQAEAAFQPVP